MPTVLLVDDNQAIRALIREIVRDPSFRILEAASAEEALDIQEEPDLLITDVGLPGINGVELARLLRQRIPELKIICMSGYMLPSHPVESVRFLEKPFRPEDLLGVVRELLGAASA